MERNCYIRYLFNGKLYDVEFSKSIENEHIVLTFADDESHTKLTVTPKQPIIIKKLFYDFNYDFGDSTVFLNGYQSWTDSRELNIKNKMPGLVTKPKKLVNKYALDGYGDYKFTEYKNKRGYFHGFTYGYIKKGDHYFLIGSLSEKNGFTVIYFDMNNGKVRIAKDCEDLSVKQNYEAFDIVYLGGEKDSVFDMYFDKMNVNKPRANKITGYTSWYNYYQDINEERILKNLDAVCCGNFKYDVFQIDDGFQQFVGDWLQLNREKFPNGLEAITRRICESGMHAGIWLAPFICELKSSLYREHPDWIVRNTDGTPFLCGNNWSYFVALDFYNPEVRDYIIRVFEHYKEIGFVFFKLDFLYAVCVIPRKDKTRGQICCEAMEFLRECVGDNLILGCGVPLAPCFGIFDYMRIGCDVSLDWKNTFLMRHIHRETPVTQHALMNTVYRSHLNGRAFLNDPDVFLLRDNNISLTPVQKELLLKVNCLFGSLIFTSDNVQEYTKEKNSLFETCLSLKDAKDILVYQKGNYLFVEFVLYGKMIKMKINTRSGIYSEAI